MTLKENTDQLIKEAMRAKDSVRLTTLRAIKAAILLAETAEGRAPGTALTEAEESKLLQKLAKQRRDAMREFREGGREDLVAKEAAELAIVEEFLPPALSPEALEAALRALIAEIGATSMKDMGKVMGLATQRLAGQAEGDAISKMVKHLLA